MFMLETIHKGTIKAYIRKRGEWRGIIAPSNVAAHGLNMFGCPIRIERATMAHRPSEFIVTTQGQCVDLDRYLYEYAHHNCGAELGRNIKFWQEVGSHAETAANT